MAFDLSRLRAAASEPPAAEGPSEGVRLVVVCTGNVCRSPLAALVLRARLAGPGVQVVSAGTHALVGHAMTPQAIDLAVERGVSRSDADAHRAAWLRETDLVGADLVLTMQRDQRRHVVELAPALVARTFTLREFARLAASVDAPAEGLPALVAQVAARRGPADATVDAVDDDVLDPYGRSEQTYRRSAAQLDPAVEVVVRLVGTSARRAGS